MTMKNFSFEAVVLDTSKWTLLELLWAFSSRARVLYEYSGFIQTKIGGVEISVDDLSPYVYEYDLR